MISIEVVFAVTNDRYAVILCVCLGVFSMCFDACVCGCTVVCVCFVRHVNRNGESKYQEFVCAVVCAYSKSTECVNRRDLMTKSFSATPTSALTVGGKKNDTLFARLDGSNDGRRQRACWRARTARP